MKKTYRRRVGQNTSIPCVWYDHLTGAVRDLSSGFVGTAKVTDPRDDLTTLVVITNVVLAATSPNFVITPTDANYTTLLGNWDGTLTANGYGFNLTPLLDVSDDEWPYEDRIELWLVPART